MKNSSFETLGWDSWFEEQARLRCEPAGAVAQVAAVDRDQLLLLNESGAFRAKYSGKYEFEAAASLERPCVGDWVCVEKSPADRFGLVQGVLGRRHSPSLRPRQAGTVARPALARPRGRRAGHACDGVRPHSTTLNVSITCSAASWQALLPCTTA